MAQLEARLSALDTAVARERDRIADAQRHLAPGSPRLKLVADSVTALSAHLDDASRLAGSFATDARTALATAREGADRALLLIGSFTDNPARRLASLILGAGLGVLVAAGVGINIFLATLGSGGSRATGSSLSDLLLGTLGIIVTGVILGLGSAPTHEVIKALQGYKDQRNGVTVDRPAAPLGRGPEGLAADPLVDATPVVRVRGTS